MSSNNIWLFLFQGLRGPPGVAGPQGPAGHNVSPIVNKWANESINEWLYVNVLLLWDPWKHDYGDPKWLSANHSTGSDPLAFIVKQKLSDIMEERFQ